MVSHLLNQRLPTVPSPSQLLPFRDEPLILEVGVGSIFFPSADNNRLIGSDLDFLRQTTRSSPVGQIYIGLSHRPICFSG